MVIEEANYLKMEKVKESASRIDRTVEVTISEIEHDHMISVLITFDDIP